jgi:hypothetical protein
VTLVLTLANAYAARFVWPHARLTPGDLCAHPAALAVAGAAGGLMGILDFKPVFVFARLDRPRVEAESDRAEHWLGSCKAPAVQALTVGLIHPRRIVGEQVRAAPVDASLAAHGELWAMSLRVVGRFAFGLAVWVIPVLTGRGASAQVND